MLTEDQRAEYAQDRQSIALTDAYSIQPYVIRVPNRTALGASFMTDKAAYHFVSLPLMSI